MKNLEEFLSEVPFDKVTILDKDGNRQVLQVHKIIIEQDGKEYYIENIPHANKPTGITISFAGSKTKGLIKYFAVYPGAANLINLSIETGILIADD